MADIDRLKERRKEAHDDFRRSVRTCRRLAHEIEGLELDREEAADEGWDTVKVISERIDAKEKRLQEAQKTREARQDDWRAARKAVNELRASSDIDDFKIESKTPGAPHWGGVRDVFDAFIVPTIIAERGNVITSRKRTETYGNPGSDHYVGNTTADAADAGVPSNDYELQNKLGEAVELDGPIHDYAAYYVEIDDVTIRFQFIAAPHGTGPHHHTGGRVA